MSTIDALVTRMTLIVYDVDAHACIDGVRLHSVKRYSLSTMMKVWKKPATCYKMATEQVVDFLLHEGVFFGMHSPTRQVRNYGNEKKLISDC
jgi:hypothetical protein